MKKYILSIDQGTTSSRAFIYDDRFEVVGMAQHTFAQHFPKADWVEHDLGEIWESVEKSIRGALQSVSRPEFDPSQIAAIGITNQRETFGVWHSKTGKSPHRAIVWQCRRSAALCRFRAGAGSALERTDQDLDAAVLRLALSRVVRGDRVARAHAGDIEALADHAAIDEIGRDRRGAAFRQRLVDGVPA